VFVNDRLALDLGGLHGPIEAYFNLDAQDGTADGAVLDFGNPYLTRQDYPFSDRDLGLSLGEVYEVRLFHAERNQCGSNFKITLRDFSRPRSSCSSVCGDGQVSSDELCDDGPEGNNGAYGRCGPDCRSRGPRCGDGVSQPEQGEQCDDGTNLTAYGQGCAPGCRTAARCGDGNVDALFGEACDDGENDARYGTCNASCQLAERCGDGSLQAPEGCDDGNLLSGDGCSSRCIREVLR
jgi:fibro-slime domain-containing protein